MTAAESLYGFPAAARILGLSENRLRYWSQVGFVGPSRRRGTGQAFTFQDLIAAKAAKELTERGFRAADVRRALDGVRAALPRIDRPLDQLRVAWDGSALVVVDEGLAFEPSGQRVFDFGIGDLARAAAAAEAPVRKLPAARQGPARPEDDDLGPHALFAQGLRQEAAGDLARAEASYARVLATDPAHGAARTNLGAIAYQKGDRETARAAFEAALAQDPDLAEARYNLASLLCEDGEFELAAAELRRVVALAPDFADAHFNLATVLERLGSRRLAREHLERYLDLMGRAGTRDDVWLEEARARLARL